MHKFLYLSLIVAAVIGTLALRTVAYRGMQSPLQRNKKVLKLSEMGPSSIPKPNIITPSQGSSPEKGIEKFLMMYTCKLCDGRNAHMVSKVAYNFGMVVASCRHCKKKHLIADNQGKLDMPEYGKKIEDYIRSQGGNVQRLSITPGDLEDNYLVDQDGELKLVPKAGGQPSPSTNIVDLPPTPLKGFGKKPSS